MKIREQKLGAGLLHDLAPKMLQPPAPAGFITWRDTNPNVSEAPNIRTTKSDTYKEIYVTGQIANLTYDGLRLAVLHDAPDLTETVDSDRFDASKMVIDRKIECTLMLSPMNLKAWTITLQKELNKYEKLFGTIPPPEAVRQKFRER